MHVLHTCPVPNVEFASLSLLMCSADSMTNRSNKSNKDYGNGGSENNGVSKQSINRHSKKSNNNHCCVTSCPESFIELTVVNSPLSTTPPSVIALALTELHETLGSQQSVENKTERKLSNNAVSRKSAQEINCRRLPYICHSRYDNNHSMDGLGSSSNDFQNMCIEEELSYHNNKAPRSFRPMHSKNGLQLTYIAVCDEQVVEQCVSIFSPSYDSRPSTPAENLSESSSPLKNASLIICVGITGMPYSYGMSSITHSLSRRLIEFSSLLSTLEASIDLLQAKKQRQNLETMLTSILIDDEYLKTNALVQLENGVTNTSEGNKGMTDVAIRKAKSNKFFGTGMSVVKKRRRKKKLTKEKDDEPKFVPTALVSSSLPSSDLSKIISSTYLILSLAEKEMALHPYQARMKRQVEYNLLRKVKGDQKMYRSPSRISRKSGKIDIGLFGSDLAGFDYMPQHSKIDGSFISVSAAQSLGNESTSTSLTSLDTASTTSIPTLSGPSRDSSASKIQFRRNKVAAASAANQYSKSWASSIGRSPRTAQPGVRRTAVLDDRKGKIKLPSNVVDKHTNFDPFSLNVEGMVSETGYIDKTSTKGKTFDDRQSSNFSTEDYATLTSKQSIVAQSSAKEVRDATKKVKTMVHIAMNEDLSCSYCNSKLTSCSVEGMIQAQIKSNTSTCVPFALTLNDIYSQIHTVLENKKYANDITHELSKKEDETVCYRYVVTLPKSNHYFPLVKYKCSDELRPVPIRVESKVRANSVHCRVALQVMSNPSNETDLTELTILMAVPPTTVYGETLSTQPPGGVWNKEKGSVIWCVTELGPGQKFQLQAQFDLVEELANDNELPQFPVLIRCQSMFTQLSDVKVEICHYGNAAELGMKLARRFRLSHKEK